MSDFVNEKLLIIGLMSGTSVDAIDVALIRSNGHDVDCVNRMSYHYKDKTRNSILQAYDNPDEFLSSAQLTSELSIAIAVDHAAAVQKMMAETNDVVQLLGFHGQTILHRPDQGITVQLGCGETLAALTQTNTVYDFRRADIEAGGQGAPLAPIYHRILIEKAGMDLPAAVLNIGGVANLSYWDGQRLIGFDTGPGNGLLDQYMQRHCDAPYDKNGELASTGVVDEKMIEAFLDNRYFDGVRPKSLDRASFNAIIESTQLAQLSANDAMATLVALSVASVNRAIEQFEHPPKSLMVCGGGQHNDYLLNELKRTALDTQGVNVTTADAMQMAGDHIEAELIGLLAARYRYKLPSTYPLTTGVAIPCVVGRFQAVSAST